MVGFLSTDRSQKRRGGGRNFTIFISTKGGAAENLKEPLPWMMKKEVTKS